MFGFFPRPSLVEQFSLKGFLDLSSFLGKRSMMTPSRLGMKQVGNFFPFSSIKDAFFP